MKHTHAYLQYKVIYMYLELHVVPQRFPDLSARQNHTEHTFKNANSGASSKSDSGGQT